MIPHLARLAVGAEHRRVLPTSMLATSVLDQPPPLRRPAR
ncbi:hypothetical protein ACIGW1_07690 [Streptomyces sp. NPDC053780]